jgi:hypothetical protein
MLAKTLLPLVGLAVMISGCQSDHSPNLSAAPSAENQSKASPERIKSHVRFLADDLLEGRDTGARGH